MMIRYFPVTSGNSDRNSLIECYFNTSNLEYYEILRLLLLVDGIRLSICQLKRVLFSKGLCRRRNHSQSSISEQSQFLVFSSTSFSGHRSRPKGNGHERDSQVPCKVPSYRIPQPVKRGWPHHWGLRPLLFSNSGVCSFMHQSIPPAPSPPPGYCGAFTRLVSPGGGAFANFALPGGRVFANPRAIPELLTRTRFPIRI